MFFYAIVGGIVAGIVSVVLPKILGAAIGWRYTVPWLFGALRLAYIRTTGATVFGIAVSAGISLNLSDHSHHILTYVLWYGLASLGLSVAVVATIVIDRYRDAVDDRVIRTRARAARDADKSARSARMRSEPGELSHATRGRLAGQPEQRVAPLIRDPTRRVIDETDKAATRPVSEHPTSNSQQETDRLVGLYREGEQLRAQIFWSAASIFGDLIRATANQKQVEREGLARDWARRVLDALSEDVRPKWLAAATLPEHKLDPASTITGVREFLETKLACLKTIIAESTADQTELEAATESSSSLISAEAEQRDARTRAINAGEEFARLIFQAELQDDGPAKVRQTVFYNFGATVEAWARTIGAAEEVPKFSGDPGADLARLKVFVSKELARLHAEQKE